MRCHICDCQDDNITFNRFEGKFSPCKACQAVILDTLISYVEDEEGEETEDNLLIIDSDDIYVIESYKSASKS